MVRNQLPAQVIKMYIRVFLKTNIAELFHRETNKPSSIKFEIRPTESRSTPTPKERRTFRNR